MDKTKLTYKVARKIYDSYRFLVADFKIKNLKKGFTRGGFLYIINLDVPFWYTIFIKKGTLMVHEKNNTHLKRTQNVKKDRNPILWGTF